MTKFYIGQKQVSDETYAAHLKTLGVTAPNILTKASNLAGAGRRVFSSILGGKAVLVSDEEQTRRMAICENCEFFNGSTCKKCGCHIRFKAKLQTEHCPILKW